MFRKSFQCTLNPIEEDRLAVYNTTTRFVNMNLSFSMNTHIQLFTITIKEFFSYRLNFVLWRLRMLLATLVTVFLWSAVFDGKTRFGYYSKEQLLSYILFSGLIMTLVSSTRTTELASHIQNGTIMNLLLKPFSLFKYYATIDAADKCINIFFGFIEFALVTSLFHIILTPPHAVFLFILFLICAVVMNFFINLMLSFIGFWTPEVWAPRFLFIMILSFVSGTFFPLDLLPISIYRLLLLTPFPYLLFMPAHTLIFGIKPEHIIQQIIGALFWTVASYILAKKMWRKGLKEFSFWGK